jgi:hypothetical protein
MNLPRERTRGEETKKGRRRPPVGRADLILGLGDSRLGLWRATERSMPSPFQVFLGVLFEEVPRRHLIKKVRT